jgi:hypothetical protein
MLKTGIVAAWSHRADGDSDSNGSADSNGVGADIGVYAASLARRSKFLECAL